MDLESTNLENTDLENTELKINDNFFGFYGAIGRREFILNALYLGMICAFLMLPYSIWSWWTISHNPSAVFDVKAFIHSMPSFIMVFYAAAAIINAVISFGLYSRRISDLEGKPQNIINYLIALGIIFCEFSSYIFPNVVTLALHILTWVVCLFFMCIRGKYTGSLPKNELKRFNWGAFWGSWIWGLINRTYITLLAIPLCFTPGGVYFWFICGIKGNEWAYENSKTKDVDKFCRGQKHQAIFWNVLTVLLAVVIPVMIIAGTINYVISNPEKFKPAAKTTISKVSQYTVKNRFEKYELSADENKFYINPVAWKYMSENNQKSLFYNAVNFAADKKSPASEGLKEKLVKEVGITKIISSYNGEILAELDMDSGKISINNNPELPSK